MITLEVCANSITSALAAQEGGAVRVELCDNLYEGGTTPSVGQIITARKLLNIGLNVMIRPRGGDFLYTDLEFESMRTNIKSCAEIGCNGVVFGLLNMDGTIDVERCTELIQLSKQNGLTATFHRAFDVSADLFKGLEDIIKMGFDRILTSGGKSTAMEGASMLNRLIKKAGDRIIIMPGSGITDQNATDLVRFTGAKEIHASAKKKIESKMSYKNQHILMTDSYGNEYIFEQTDADLVKGIIAKANG